MNVRDGGLRENIGWSNDTVLDKWGKSKVNWDILNGVCCDVMFRCAFAANRAQ